VRRATGLDFSPLEVELGCPRPSDVYERERVFGCGVRYARPSTRIWLSRETWERTVPSANEVLLSVLEAHASGLLATLPRDPPIVRKVRDVLKARLGEEALSLRQVARELGTSGRALQRALAEVDSSYSHVLAETRMNGARTMLADRDLSIAEIALRLGFSEQSAFTRAYKRWSGVPPAKMRPARRPARG